MKQSGHRSANWFLRLLCAVLTIMVSALAHGAEIAVLHNGFTIRHDHHLVMGTTTRLFFSADEQSFTDVATSDIDSYQKDLTPPPPPSPAPATAINTSVPKPLAAPPVNLNQVVNSASANYHLDPDLVNSVIHAESGFNAHAVSPKGARGLMQLMPSTADQLGVKDSFDPEANVGGGSRYLRELLERYNFDLVKALAAYNAGPERVEQYKGVPPFHETRAYVARIIHEYNQKIAKEEREAARAQKLTRARTSKSGAAHTALAGTSSSHAPVAHTSTTPTSPGIGHKPPSGASAQITSSGSNSSR
jgi:hypothetical protein